MRNLLGIFITVIFGLSLFIQSCSSSSPIIEGDDLEKEGWIDNDTYQLFALGVSAKTQKSKWARRRSSRNLAMLNAEYQFTEKFKDLKKADRRNEKKIELTKLKVSQILKKYFRRGRVRKVFYNVNGDCKLIYQVKRKNLKNLIGNID